MSRWRTAVIRRPTDVADLAEWWDTQPGADEIFHARAVLERWEDGWFREGSRLAVQLLLRDGEPVAALPLYSVGWRHFSFGTYWAEPYDVIGAADDATRERLGWWLRRVPYARIFNIRAGSVLGDVVASGHGEVFQERPGWDMDLTPGFETILRRVEAKDRNAAARKLRRLAEFGAPRFVEERDSLAMFEAGLVLEQAGWKGREREAVLSRQRDVPWTRAVADVLREQGRSRSMGLYLDDRLVAYGLSFVGRGYWTGSISAFDESRPIAKHSPGYVLLVESARRACAEGLPLYRLGAGEQHWKRRWATRRVPHRMVLFLGSGPRGRSVHLRRRLRDRAG